MSNSTLDCPTCHFENPDGAKHCQECGSALRAGACDPSSRPVPVPAEGPTMEKLGKAFSGKYRIERKVGSGGMGEIFEGRHVALGNSVAIKVLSSPLNRDEDLVRRFFREARSAAALKHPNIINIQDVGQYEDLYYMVMDFVDGQDLKSLIKTHPNIDPLRAIDIISQVAHALSHAHSRGIVHRDIKPANIMIDQHGTALVMDFGIARVRDATSQLTREGFLIGTPHYMSPEQCKGEVVTHQSDLYSLGVVFYQLLSGRVPYEGHDSLSIIYQKIHTSPPPLGESRRNLQPELVKIVHRMLERELSSRYPNADTLLADLDRVGTELKADRAASDLRSSYATPASASALDQTTPMPGPAAFAASAAGTKVSAEEQHTTPLPQRDASWASAAASATAQETISPTRISTRSDGLSAARSQARAPRRFLWPVMAFLLLGIALGGWWVFRPPTPTSDGQRTQNEARPVEALPPPPSAGGQAPPIPAQRLVPPPAQGAGAASAGGRAVQPSPGAPRPSDGGKRINPLSLNVRHRHGMGNCEGLLTIAPSYVSYAQAGHGKDSFQRSYAQIQFSGSGSRLSLRFSDRKYDFDLPSAAVQEEAFGKLKEFASHR